MEVNWREKFENIITYLKENLVPANPETGVEYEEIEFKGDDEVKLSESDVLTLCTALEQNTKYSGPLKLPNHALTDQSALYISELLRKNYRIRGLDLSQNNFSEKAGMFIGESLKSKENYQINMICFRNNNLRVKGIQRICEFLIQNTHIKTMSFGILSNPALQIVSKFLPKTKLQNIELEEDPNSKWEEKTKFEFIAALKANRSIFNIEIHTENKKFVEECKFNLKVNLKVEEEEGKVLERQNDFDTERMVVNMLEMVEKAELNCWMPVRQHYDNTFGRLLSDAVYELQRKRTKFPDSHQYFKVNASVKFIATYLLQNLPHNEPKKHTFF